MKQRDLLKKIREAAAGAGLSYETGHGGSHDWLSVDGKKVAFPRHSEINELTARGDPQVLRGQVRKGLVEVTTYTVTVRRSGDWWALLVPEAGLFSQVKSLDGTEAMVRDGLGALGLDVDAELTITYDLPDDLQAAVDTYHRAAREAAAAQERSRQALREAAATLTDAHVTKKDTGRLLGVTGQRIGQLA
jgi:hypothetical protein